MEDELGPAEMRVPRITNATWRTENGGTASFIHGVVLHGERSHPKARLMARGRLRL